MKIEKNSFVSKLVLSIIGIAIGIAISINEYGGVKFNGSITHKNGSTSNSTVTLKAFGNFTLNHYVEVQAQAPINIKCHGKYKQNAQGLRLIPNDDDSSAMCLSEYQLSKVTDTCYLIEPVNYTSCIQNMFLCSAEVKHSNDS